jgi:cell division transport system permease protein
MVSLIQASRRTAAGQTDSDGEARLRRDMPLVPATSIAGRALVTVIAIMTFLAALTAGTAILIAEASQAWRASIGQEMTIQVRPAVGRDLDAETAKAVEIAAQTPGVASARAFSKAESEALLQPWLGAGLDLSELPVPRLIVLKLDGSGKLDAAALRSTLTDKVAGASLDDHRLWLARLSIMAKTVVFVAIVIFALVVVAMMLAVAFATRGAMAGSREIIEVLHFVGAADSFISRQFQRHFFRLGLRGGAIGGGTAILVFLSADAASSWWRATPSGDQIEAMFGSFALSPLAGATIVVMTAAIAGITGIVSRVIVFRHLRRLA